MFQFYKNRILWNQKLGSGDSSSIYPYQQDSDDRKWVIKHTSKDNFDEFLLFIQRVSLGLNLDHPNVLPVQAFYSEEKQYPKKYEVYIKFEKMDESLRGIITRYSKYDSDISEKKIVQWFYDLISGLEYLHGKRIAHMNIHPNNILFDYQDNVKLADIGQAKFDERKELDSVKQSEQTVPSYWAPEFGIESTVLKEEDLFLSDIWGLGRTIMKLCNPGSREVRERLLSKDVIESEIRENLIKIKANYGEVLESILAGMLKYYPTERMVLGAIRKTLEENYSEILV